MDGKDDGTQDLSLSFFLLSSFTVHTISILLQYFASSLFSGTVNHLKTKFNLNYI